MHPSGKGRFVEPEGRYNSISLRDKQADLRVQGFHLPLVRQLQVLLPPGLVSSVASLEVLGFVSECSMLASGVSIEGWALGLVAFCDRWEEAWILLQRAVGCCEGRFCGLSLREWRC